MGRASGGGVPGGVLAGSIPATRAAFKIGAGSGILGTAVGSGRVPAGRAALTTGAGSGMRIAVDSVAVGSGEAGDSAL